MTRIAAGHPGIWPDICTENRDAIVDELDGLIAALQGVRNVVADGNREALVEILDQARSARIALPARFSKPEDLVELRIPVADRAGVLAEILLLAAEVDVSIFDIEIAHSSEGPQGVLILVVEADAGEVLRTVLVAHGYSPSSLRTLE